MREYMIRVTRHPLSAEDIAEMESNGNLPADHASRSVEETDFVQVEAANDSQAATRAIIRTSLGFKGENASFHEAMRDGSFRELDLPAPQKFEQHEREGSR